MTPQAISSLPSNSATRGPATKNFNDLKSEDFFGLLIAQLQAQDPLKPTDNQTLMTQMSTIRQMEMSSNLNTTLESLAAEQRFGSTSSLIGQYVGGTLKDNSGNDVVVKGVVVGVRFEPDGRAILDLHDGGQIPADKVQQVTLVQNLPPELQQQLAADGAPPTAAGKTIPAVTAANARSVLANRTTPPRVNPTPEDSMARVLQSILDAGAGL